VGVSPVETNGFTDGMAGRLAFGAAATVADGRNSLRVGPQSRMEIFCGIGLGDPGARKSVYIELEKIRSEEGATGFVQ
jgi:hypothetical protein